MGETSAQPAWHDLLTFDAAGLVTVVVQDHLTGEVRMLGHANQEALAATLRTRKAHFFSRSRQALWMKGESSGHVLEVAEVWADCDADAVLYLVEPRGPTCHTGTRSCFFRRLDAVDQSNLDGPPAIGAPLMLKLWDQLVERTHASEKTSYTRTLLEKGYPAISEKLREEAQELCTAIESEADDRVTSEAADLSYHMLVGLLSRQQTWRHVLDVLSGRLGIGGLEEKRRRDSKNA